MESQQLLIVEDNPTLQHMVRLMAKRLGLSAQVVGTCGDAITAATSGTIFAAIMMDWSLPDHSGLECVKSIRQFEANTGRHVPIIAMTGNAMTGDREACMEAGMDDYLSKPFTFAEFTNIVKKWTAPATEPQPLPHQQEIDRQEETRGR